MNIYRSLNVLFHIITPFVWIANLLCVIYYGWFSVWGANLFVTIVLPIVVIKFWIYFYLNYRQPTFWKTIWFVIKNK